MSASVPDHTTIVHLNKMSGFCNKLVRWSDVTEKELKSNGTHELAIGNEFIHKFARICEQIQSIDNWTTKEATSVREACSWTMFREEFLSLLWRMHLAEHWIGQRVQLAVAA